MNVICNQECPLSDSGCDHKKEHTKTLGCGYKLYAYCKCVPVPEPPPPDLEHGIAINLLAGWIAIEHGETRLQALKYVTEAGVLTDFLHVIGYCLQGVKEPLIVEGGVMQPEPTDYNHDAGHNLEGYVKSEPVVSSPLEELRLSPKEINKAMVSWRGEHDSGLSWEEWIANAQLEKVRPLVETLQAENKDLTRKGESLCQQNGILLVERYDIEKRIAELEEKLTDVVERHTLYREGRKE